MSLEQIKTKENLDTFLKDLDKLLLELFASKDSDVNIILKNYDYKFAEIIRKILSNSNISSSDKVGMERTLRSLEKDAENLQLVELTLSLAPSESMVSAIHAWLLESVGISAVLDIKIDSKILGGVILSYGGIYKDYSILKRLKEYEF